MEVAEIQLVYSTRMIASERPTVTSSNDAYNIFRKYWNRHTIELVEEAKLLLLNRANRVLGIYHLSSGGCNCTVIDPKLVFAVSLKAAASGIILAHNHPSQNLRPSQRDLQITQKLKAGATLLDIELLDHLIIAKEGYYSFRDEGLL